MAPGCWFQSISASIAKPKAGYVRINEPVVVDFNQKIDAKSIKLALVPAADFTVLAKGDKLMVTPVKGWRPDQKYSLQVKSVTSSDHQLSLNNWKGTFKTQPHAGIAGFLLDGKALALTAGTTPSIAPLSKITITFTSAMLTTSTIPMLNGQPLAASAFAWARDDKAVTINQSYLPYSNVSLGIPSTAQTATGDSVTDTLPLGAVVTGLEPSNGSTNIPATGYQTPPSLEVVIDNAGLARPQSGLQTADMAFEYISEYNISRFTLMFFGTPSQSIGPVRSCRMINPYLGDAFRGITLCSGASDGTLGYLWGRRGVPGVPVVINDYDTGNHFFRVDWREAPHNVYTDAGRVSRVRQEHPIGGGNYVVDPAHQDNNLGDPAAAPSIPLQGVTYSYDTGCTCYRPFDHGAPRTDAAQNNSQLAVKNVVVMQVPFGNAGWVEDVNGGAQSIRYQMNGSGPAQIWSDGKLVNATWHMGQAGQDYYQNTTQPLYFTDQNGNLIRLNTGLTWVHVVGNGQTQ